MALGQFMVVVDVTILNIALPSLAADLEADMPELEWALIAYSLTMIGLVPIFGRISDVLGRKRLYVTGLALFGLASALAAASPAIEALIAARVLQAIGGALITSNTLAILTDVFPVGERGVAMGLQSVLISGGAAIGPVLGGFLVTHFGWEAVFLVNLPVGAASALLATKVLPSLKSGRAREPLDWPGAALLLGGLFGTLMGLTRAPEWGWADPRTLGAFGVGLPLLALFAWRQRRATHPLVKPSLMTIRPFVAGQVAGLFATMVLVSMVFLLPFYWQALRGLSAQRAGLLMLPVPLSLMVMAPIAGRLSDRIGARGLTSVGLVGGAAAAFLIGQVDERTAVVDVLWRLALFGLSLGMFLAPNNNATMSAAPAADRGVASGLLALFRFTGQVLGIAFAGTLFLHAAGHADSTEILTAEGIRASADVSGMTADFVVGYRTVCLAVVPIALVGAALSFSRGAHPEAGR
ncbi:MAG TPA: MFS transporter [Sandaracinaceae bacterium LLY-WYZ-13_1]|nr:MFS transporter [Sandaracinaceae bacterium LLY-WYZ-13_1]